MMIITQRFTNNRLCCVCFCHLVQLFAFCLLEKEEDLTIKHQNAKCSLNYDVIIKHQCFYLKKSIQLI